MHFKWDSNVARDIASEPNRLEGKLRELISRYITLTGNMWKARAR